MGSERVENAGFTTGPKLSIAQAAGGDDTLSALAQGVRRILGRIEDSDGPMNDHIFATFLEGRAPGPLDVRLPANIRALLLDKPGRAKTLTRKVPGDPGWLDYLLVMPLSFVYWGLIVVAAGVLLISLGSEEDLLTKAFVRDGEADRAPDSRDATSLSDCSRPSYYAVTDCSSCAMGCVGFHVDRSVAVGAARRPFVLARPHESTRRFLDSHGDRLATLPHLGRSGRSRTPRWSNQRSPPVAQAAGPPQSHLRNHLGHLLLANLSFL